MISWFFKKIIDCKLKILNNLNAWRTSTVCKIFIFYQIDTTSYNKTYCCVVHWKTEICYKTEDFYEYFLDSYHKDMEELVLKYDPILLNYVTFDRKDIPDLSSVIRYLEDFGNFCNTKIEYDHLIDLPDEKGIKYKIFAIVCKEIEHVD